MYNKLPKQIVESVTAIVFRDVKTSVANSVKDYENIEKLGRRLLETSFITL